MKREKLTGRTKIERLLNNNLDGFCKECLRYGTIQNTVDYKTYDNTKYRRKFIIDINGFRAYVIMENGEYIEGGLSINQSDFDLRF